MRLLRVALGHVDVLRLRGDRRLDRRRRWWRRLRKGLWHVHILLRWSRGRGGRLRLWLWWLLLLLLLLLLQLGPVADGRVQHAVVHKVSRVAGRLYPGQR